MSAVLPVPARSARSPAKASPLKAEPATRACAQQVLASVPVLMREIRAAMRRAAPEGLTVPQFRALIFAQRQPGGSVGDLAAHLGVTLPTASVAVAGSFTSPLSLPLIWAQTEADFSQRLAALPASQMNSLRDALALLSTGLSTSA